MRTDRWQFGVRTTLVTITVCAWYFTCVRLVKLGFDAAFYMLLLTAVVLGALALTIAARRLGQHSHRRCALAAGGGAAVAGTLQGLLNIQLFTHLYPLPEDVILMTSSLSFFAVQISVLTIVAFVIGAAIGLLDVKLRR